MKNSCGKSLGIVVIVLVVAILAHQGEALFGLEDGYTQLNNYLVDKETSTSLTENVKLVEELTNSANAVATSKSLLQAATLFLNLAQSKGKCGRTSFEILRGNVDATKGEAIAKSPPSRRIDNLVYQLALEHASECPKVYEQVWSSRLINDFGKQTLEKLEVLSENIRKRAKIEVKATRKYLWMVTDENLFDTYNMIEIIDANLQQFADATLDTIVQAASEDPNVIYAKPQIDQRVGKKVFDAVKLEDLYNFYILEPCKRYVSSYEADVFEPAEFDLRITKSPYLSDGPNNVDVRNFKKGWLLFRMCKHFVHDISKPLLKEMSKRILIR